MTARAKIGLRWAVMAAAISGISVFANSLVVKGIDPLIHTTIKNGVAGVLVIAVLMVSSEWRIVKKLNKRQITRLLSIALVGGSFAFYLFFAGLKMIGASQGALIQKTLVVWIALMAVPLLKEKVSFKMAAGIVLLYASSLIVGVNGFKGLMVGHGLVLAATLLWAIENIIAKVTLKDLPVNVVVAARMGLGSLILLALVWQQQKLPLMLKLTSSQWLMLTGVGILLFGYVMSWYRALKILPATVTASVIVGASVVTTLLDAVLVTKAVTVSALWQSGMVVTGIYLVVLTLSKSWQQNKTTALTAP